MKNKKCFMGDFPMPGNKKTAPIGRGYKNHSVYNPEVDFVPSSKIR